jgi:hypothetical protein
MKGNKIILLFFGALIALAIYLLMADSTGEIRAVDRGVAMAEGAPSQSAIAEPENPVVLRQPNVHSEIEDWNVEIRVSGLRIDFDGLLHFSSGETAKAQPIEVTEGRCSIPEVGWRQLLESGDATWFLPSYGFPSKVASISKEQKESQEKFLVLNLGTRKRLQVTITDLRGGPVPYAKLQIYGALAPEKSRQVCDEFGIWSGEVFGDGQIRLIARAKGYGNKSAQVDFLDGEEEVAIHLRLGRFMAIGGVLDRRERFGFRSVEVEVGHHSMSPATPDSREILDQIENRANLNREYELVSWQVLTENDEWLEGEMKLIRYHPDAAVPPEEIQVPLKHILDPTFELYRFSDAWPKELHPLEVRLTPESKFVSGVYPEFINLNWEGLSGNANSYDYVGWRRTSDEPTYLFFVPDGEYSIQSSTSERRLRYGKAPLIEPIERFQVMAGILPPQSLQLTLANTCFYSGYEMVDASGMQLGVAGLLTEVREEKNTSYSFMAPMFSGPQYQFFTGTPSQLWLSPYGLWAESIGEPFQVAPPAQGEILRIKVPAESLTQILSQS